MACKHIVGVVTLVVMTLITMSCDAIHFMDRKRTMTMACRRQSSKWLASCEKIFDQNGYSVVELDTAANVLVAQDSVTDLEYRYTLLVRTFRVQHTGDSVLIDCYSVSTRLDGSDVVQTWDRKWSGEEVKSWMRPILAQIQTSCGAGTPIAPSGQ